VADAEPPAEGEPSAETTRAEPDEPIAVLDASALMAHLNDEPGAESGSGREPATSHQLVPLCPFSPQFGT